MDVLSDCVQIGVAKKGLQDDDLRRHLLMHASRLSTYPLVREELRSIIVARDTLTGPAPMDTGAIHKGKGQRQGEEGQHTGKVTASETAGCSRETRTRME